MSDDIPLHLVNLEREKAVLGVLLGAPDKLEIARDILATGTAFADERHQRIYTHILRLADSGSGFDVVTLRAALQASGDTSACGGEPYVTQLRDGYPRASMLEEYARGVHDLWCSRRAYFALADLKARFEQPGGFEDADPVEAVLGAFTQLDANNHKALTFIDGPGMSRRLMELAQAAAEGQMSGTSTGFPTLDASIRGGLQPGELFVVGGRPGTGKSALVANIALNIARDKTVIVFSQEMSSDENVERFGAILGGVDMSRVRQGRIAQSDYAKIVHAVGLLEQSNLKLNDACGITAHAVKAVVRRYQATGHVGAVVIDYLQQMSAGRERQEHERRDQVLGAITKALKAMAKELRVPIVLVASLNRMSATRTDKRPELWDLKDSGDIESDADVVLFTYRDEMVNPNSPDKDITELVIRKGRNCKIGTIKLRFDPEFTRFRELESWAA